jgi:hypothetical protein
MFSGGIINTVSYPFSAHTKKDPVDIKVENIDADKVHEQVI